MLNKRFTLSIINMLIQGTFTINKDKKLAVRVTKEEYERLTTYIDTKKFEKYSSPLWSPEEGTYFAFVTLDKYDRQNMPKFERLLRKDVNITAYMDSYDFSTDEGRRCGFRLVLNTIYAKQQNASISPPKPTLIRQPYEITATDAELEEIFNEEAAKAEARLLKH